MAQLKNMPPKLIQQAILKSGYTQSGLARDLHCSMSHLSRVVNGVTPSDRVRRHIARAINMDVADIWPETYLLKADPTKPGRPLTKGLFSHAA